MLPLSEVLLLPLLDFERRQALSLLALGTAGDVVWAVAQTAARHINEEAVLEAEGFEDDLVSGAVNGAFCALKAACRSVAQDPDRVLGLARRVSENS